MQPIDVVRGRGAAIAAIERLAAPTYGLPDGWTRAAATRRGEETRLSRARRTCRRPDQVPRRPGATSALYKAAATAHDPSSCSLGIQWLRFSKTGRSIDACVCSVPRSEERVGTYWAQHACCFRRCVGLAGGGSKHARRLAGFCFSGHDGRDRLRGGLV